MPHIQVEDIRKTFAIARRAPGVWGAVRGLVHRSYRDVEALKGITFAIEPGELVGYIGPNGAGKSTTVKILCGILVPDSGVCEVAGRTPWRQRVENAQHIGVVFGQRTQLWWDLPVVESFDLLGEIYRVPRAAYLSTRDELVKWLDIGALLDTPVRQLSLGQRMRCDIAAALLHRPDTLYLDEPTIGLDAVAKLAVRRFIREINEERGTTVILTTHDMDDIEALCRRVLLIGDGRLLFDGDLPSLRARATRERRLILDMENGAAEPADPDATVVHREGNRLHLTFDPDRVAATDLIARITAQCPVRDLFVENLPIEEIIAGLYQRESL